MEKTQAIGVLCAICFAVLAVESSFAAPPVQNPSVSFRNGQNIHTDSDAVVVVYIPRTFQNKSISRKNFILEILTKLSDVVHKSSEDNGDEVTTFETENLLKDRINKSRVRPALEMDESKRPVDFPSMEDEETSKENDSRPQFSVEGGPLTFQDRHNPNNILQKGSLVPNSQNSDKKKHPTTGMQSSGAGATHSDSKRNTFDDFTSQVFDTKDLTFDILRYGHWGDENTIISPFSVYNCLALLLLGADGQTFNELVQKVRKSGSLQSSDEEKILMFHESFRRLLTYLKTKSGSDVSLEIANIFYTDEKYPVKESFLANAREYYDTPVNAIDFETEGDLFKKAANNWVSQKTHKKIENIVQEIPSRTTTFAFINAVYFKAEWEKPFPLRFTRKKDFFISPTEKVTTNLMTNQISLPYMENENFQMISLPYKDKKIAFFVILPKEINGAEGLKSLESRLNSKIITDSISSMKVQNIAVKIPKMSIRTDGHMQDILTRMGLSSMFNSQTANFSRMSDKKGLYVSSVYHQACVDVDESGTTASAATAGIGDRTIDEIPITFIANRPFLFFIYHIRGQTILFWGRFLRPQQVNE